MNAGRTAPQGEQDAGQAESRGDSSAIHWGSLRKPDEPPAPTMSEWVAKIAAASTPKRELDAEGRFQPWIRREGAA